MIHFMRYRYLYYVISALVIVPGLLSLVVWGFKPSIDFTGGTVLEFQVKPEHQDTITEQLIRETAQKLAIEDLSVEKKANNIYHLQSKPFDQAKNTDFKNQLASASGVATISAALEEQRFETLGPTLGSETLRRALAAVAVAAVIIFLFIWRQFKDKKYGFSAVSAMFHDVLVVIGTFSLLGYFFNVEVDTLFMTALLTTLSFSVHDTIVVYDRIRESSRRFSHLPFETLVDKAINETFTRSINNSMTIIFMLLVLFLMGGETTKWFVFALLIGTVTGTYSSPFVAGPLLVEWENWKKRK